MKFLLLPVHMILVPSCRETSTTITLTLKGGVQFNAMCFHLETSRTVGVYAVFIHNDVWLHVWKL